MIKQLVLNFGIFVQKLKAFNGTLPSRTTSAHHNYVWAHTRGRGPIYCRWVTDGNSLTAHNAKRWRSALFHDGISFFIMSYTLPDMKEVNSDQQTHSQCMPLRVWATYSCIYKRNFKKISIEILKVRYFSLNICAGPAAFQWVDVYVALGLALSQSAH